MDYMKIINPDDAAIAKKLLEQRVVNFPTEPDFVELEATVADKEACNKLKVILEREAWQNHLLGPACGHYLAERVPDLKYKITQ